MTTPLIAIVAGSKSDWPTMEHATLTLDGLKIPYEYRVLSAHRTPEALQDYVKGLEHKGVKMVIAAAGGAAHLAGVVAAHTLLPVIGVPMTSALNGLDSLLSTVQMPGGIPVATMAIGKAGAINAALFSASILAVESPEHREAIEQYRKKQRDAILES